MFHDCIIAISSPPTTGAIRGIVRIAGPRAWDAALAICDGRAATDWQGNINIRFAADAAVRGALLFFKGPKSYTGEDIAELHIPNSPPLLQAVIESLLAAAHRLGIAARTAEPGEFSSRSFFNGKLDLTRAEGIAATINAANQTQLRAAAGMRQGTLHKQISRHTERIANLLAQIEAGIDFADEEDIRFIDDAPLRAALAELLAELHVTLASAVHIDQLAAPPTVVFVGKPNVGKSSLINALTGTQRSIVSPEAGTTRDILTATLTTPQGDIRLLDVPGEEAPTDELRQKMMATRALALLDADLVVEVLDATAVVPTPSSAGVQVERSISSDTSRVKAAEAVGTPEFASPSIRIHNKSDLIPESTAPGNNTAVSAKTGKNIDVLRMQISQIVTGREHAGGERLALNHRHRELLLETARTLQKATSLVAEGGGGGRGANKHPELLAAELRTALDLLGQITGTISPDEVLGRIFSQFCIGK